MTRRYSAFGLFREGLRGHSGWQPAWRSPKPKPSYDAVIVGGGGHGHPPPPPTTWRSTTA